MARLRDKQRLFIEHYLQCWNGTEAARRAGYKGNDATLATVASENLRKPKIRAAIERRLSAEVMSANEVLWRLGEQARADLYDFFTIGPDTGKPTLDLNKAKDAGKLHLIKRLKYNSKTGLPEIELHDQQKALELVGKRFALFVETHDHNVTIFDLEEWRKRRDERLSQIDEMPDSEDEDTPGPENEGAGDETENA